TATRRRRVTRDCAATIRMHARSCMATATGSSSTTPRRRGYSIRVPRAAHGLMVAQAASCSKRARKSGASSHTGLLAPAEARLAPLQKRLRPLAHVLGRKARRERLRFIVEALIDRALAACEHRIENPRERDRRRRRELIGDRRDLLVELV